MTLQTILKDLQRETIGSRTTLRLDMPDKNLHVDTVAVEALAPGVLSIKDDDSIAQRNLPTVKFLEKERTILVQNDCMNADPAPPPELIDFYGVKAQMLAPLVRDQQMIGWISVHYTPGPRSWSEKDIASLQEAVERVWQELNRSD